MNIYYYGADNSIFSNNRIKIMKFFKRNGIAPSFNMNKLKSCEKTIIVDHHFHETDNHTMVRQLYPH